MARSELPPSVRWIRRARRWVHRRQPRLLLAGAAATLALAVATSGLFTVANGESAARVRFGRLVDDAVGPGLHVRLPFGIERVETARTADVFRLEIAGEGWGRLDLVTGDENLVDASLVVQFRVSRLGTFLFAGESPEELIAQAVRSALVAAVATSPVEELLTSGKAEVQNRVRREAQARLDRYGVGVALVSVALQSLQPPGEAAQAFRDVSDARAQAVEATHRAEAERERSLGLARGQAGQLVSAAEAAASSRAVEAGGAAERFGRLLAEKQRSPRLVREDLRAETLAKVLPRVRLIVLAPGEKPRLDVQILERRSNGPAVVAPPRTPATDGADGGHD